MAGSIRKGIGITLIILSSLAILVGLGAAGYGFLSAQDEQDKGLFGDRQAGEDMVAVAVVGLATAGGGVLLLILGILLVVSGSGAARRAEREAPWGPGDATDMPATAAIVTHPSKAMAAPASKTRMAWGVAGVVAALILVSAAIVLATDDPFSTSAARVAGTQMDQVQTETVQGHVQGARAPVLGGINPQASDSQHTFTPQSGGSLSVQLDWTTSTPAGASTLVVVLEARATNGDWQEIGRGEGGPGLVVETGWRDFQDATRARVFVGGDGAADQDYELTFTLTP